ncbi:MAG: hypothetical protein Q4B51_03690 [Coriobacteriaceae bacterium]|nr:hypothetical protein [Coriobacteriaceae bacterium]
MSWYGDRISESSFRRYSNDVEDAIGACSTEVDIRKLSQMYEFIERESDEFITEAALEQASYIAQGMYIRSSQAQDAATDAFCKDALGLKSAPVRRVEFDAMGLMRKAYDAAKSADDGARAEAFARAVADGVASSCIGIANDRMSENVAYSGRSEYVRYAHVPTSSKVCGFCCMVASRDFAYKNPKRPSLHEGCRCLIVPGLKDKTVLGGYEPDVYRKGYDLLVKRGKHGEIVRDADGIPVFKSGLVFDIEKREVIWRERTRERKAFGRSHGQVRASGALNDVKDPSGVRRDSFAVSYYDQIRKRDRASVIEKIAESSGTSFEIAEKAYEYLFVRKYHLHDGYRSFDPDYDMAQSLQRLIDLRKVFMHDAILVRHEALEFEYMSEGMDYDAAHRKAAERYDYYKALIDWKGFS